MICSRMEWSDTQTVVRLWSLRPWLYKWHQVPPLELPDKTLDDRWRKWLREASLLDNSRYEEYQVHLTLQQIIYSLFMTTLIHVFYHDHAALQYAGWIERIDKI